jgi:hypothetical protein
VIIGILNVRELMSRNGVARRRSSSNGSGSSRCPEKSSTIEHERELEGLE